MSLIFDNPAVPSTLIDPKDLKLELLVGRDYESDGTTLRTATYDGADILLDGAPILTAENVKALDLTFDSSDNALVIYTDVSDNVYLYEQSNDQVTDFSVTGEDPRIHNDRQVSESIVLSYLRGNGVFYRLSADSTPADPHFSDVIWLTDYEAGVVDLSPLANPIAQSGGGVTLVPGAGPFGDTSAVNNSVFGYIYKDVSNNQSLAELFHVREELTPEITFEVHVQLSSASSSLRMLYGSTGNPGAVRDGLQVGISGASGWQGHPANRIVGLINSGNVPVSTFSSSVDFPFGVDYAHCALTFTETRVYIHQNGVLVSDVARVNCGVQNVDLPTRVAFLGDQRLNVVSLDGQSDNIRVTRVARYGASNFTPPTAPYPTQ